MADSNGDVCKNNDNEELKDETNVERPSRVKNTKKVSFPARHGSVIGSLKAILTNRRWADFTLKSGGREWPVHRTILEGRSRHFAALLRGEWAERDEVRLDGVTDDALDGVLHFIYAGEVAGMSVENACVIYAAAHAFLLENLKSLCVEYMKEEMCPELVCGALAIAETYGEGGLRESAFECYFRESNRICVTEGWRHLKENHPAIIGKLFEELIKRESKSRRKEQD